MNFDVFISYSTQDKPAADAACATLENAGIRCWIAPRDIRPGQDWDESIVRAIDQCRAMVLIFTQHTNESKQVGREVKRAFNKEVPVIPLRVENTVPGQSLGFYLDSVHWLDAFTPPLEAHLKQLADVAKAILEVDRPNPTEIFAAATNEVSPLVPSGEIKKTHSDETVSLSEAAESNVHDAPQPKKSERTKIDALEPNQETKSQTSASAPQPSRSNFDPSPADHAPHVDVRPPAPLHVDLAPPPPLPPALLVPSKFRLAAEWAAASYIASSLNYLINQLGGSEVLIRTGAGSYSPLWVLVVAITIGVMLWRSGTSRQSAFYAALSVLAGSAFNLLLLYLLAGLGLSSLPAALIERAVWCLILLGVVSFWQPKARSVSLWLLATAAYEIGTVIDYVAWVNHVSVLSTFGLERPALFGLIGYWLGSTSPKKS